VMNRVGQNHIYIYIYAVYDRIIDEIPAKHTYILCKYMVLAKPSDEACGALDLEVLCLKCDGGCRTGKETHCKGAGTSCKCC